MTVVSHMLQETLRFAILNQVMTFSHIISGDWKGQLEHIYVHLINQCKLDLQLQSSVGRPKIGKVQLTHYFMYFISVAFLAKLI